LNPGSCVAIVAASSAPELFEILLDVVADAVFGVLAVIAAIVGRFSACLF
jgi:hypothetical protein